MDDTAHPQERPIAVQCTLKPPTRDFKYVFDTLRRRLFAADVGVSTSLPTATLSPAAAAIEADKNSISLIHWLAQWSLISFASAPADSKHRICHTTSNYHTLMTRLHSASYHLARKPLVWRLDWAVQWSVCGAVILILIQQFRPSFSYKNVSAHPSVCSSVHVIPVLYQNG